MAKKTNKGDKFGAVFQNVISDKTNSPSEQTPKRKIKTTPMTFKIEEDLLFSIRALSFWNKTKQQDIINSSIRTHLENMPEGEREKAEEEYKRYMDR